MSWPQTHMVCQAIRANTGRTPKYSSKHWFWLPRLFRCIWHMFTIQDWIQSLRCCCRWSRNFAWNNWCHRAFRSTASGSNFSATVELERRRWSNPSSAATLAESSAERSFQIHPTSDPVLVILEKMVILNGVDNDNIHWCVCNLFHSIYIYIKRSSLDSCTVLWVFRV